MIGMAYQRTGYHVTPEDRALRTKGYVVETEMGSGAYSKGIEELLKMFSVKKVRRRGTDEKRAVKIIDRSKAKEHYLLTFLPRELEIIRAIEHPNIIQTFDIFEQNHRTFIVMELAPRGDLEQFISLHGALNETGPVDAAHTMFRQALEAIAYLHASEIAHRDIKCENLMLDRHKNLKLGDFGFARRCRRGELSSTYCGSLAYTAPELVRAEPYDPFPSDLWSMGVVLFIILVGLMPFDDSEGPARLIAQQNNREVVFDAGKPSESGRELIRSLLEPDPLTRATATDSIESEWMRNTPHYNRPDPPPPIL